MPTTLCHRRDGRASGAPHDWTTLALFCALALLFLQRSIGPAVPGDRTISYLPPALGCMAANGLGNAGHDVAAIAVILATLGYAAFVLRPWVRPH